MTTTTSTSTSTSTSTATATAARSKLNANFDTFIKMLTTQLQYQDPMNPTDTSEFTNQLVMYSQVEQQMNGNDKLDQLIKLSQGAGVQSALGYLGWEVSSNSSNLPLQSGEAHFKIDVEDVDATVTLSITDANGKFIRSMTMDDVNTTTGEIVWDGTDRNGVTVADGNYKLSVSAKNAGGTAVKSTLTTYGIVTAIDVDDDGNTVLKMGDTTISQDDILSIRSPVSASTTTDTTTDTTT